MNSTQEIIAAADGSALGNPGPAGWAWYIDDDHWASGGWAHGTNNMGELKAVLDLFEATASRPEAKLRVYCDSQYVINSLTKWMPGWKKKGWKKSDGKPVLNRDLLEALDQALTGRDYEFIWLRGTPVTSSTRRLTPWRMVLRAPTRRAASPRTVPASARLPPVERTPQRGLKRLLKLPPRPRLPRVSLPPPRMPTCPCRNSPQPRLRTPSAAWRACAYPVCCAPPPR